MNDTGIGILGVIIGALLIFGIFAHIFGDRLGLRAPRAIIAFLPFSLPEPW